MEAGVLLYRVESACLPTERVYSFNIMNNYLFVKNRCLLLVTIPKANANFAASLEKDKWIYFWFADFKGLWTFCSQTNLQNLSVSCRIDVRPIGQRPRILIWLLIVAAGCDFFRSSEHIPRFSRNAHTCDYLTQ